MKIESEEVDFSQEIVSDGEGNISLEPLHEEEEETETEKEAETEGEKEFTGEEEAETETEGEAETGAETETGVEAETKTEESNFEPFEATVNGHKITVEDADEAKKIIDNLSKPKLEQPNVWEQAQEKLGVTTKDLALISAIKGGDKQALLFLAKQSGLDIADMIYDEAPDSFDKDFEPTVMTEGQLIMNDIQNSGEFETFSTMLDATDASFIQNLADPQNLTAFRRQVASGKAAELMPLAKKLSALENIPLFDAYAKVGHEQSTKQGKSEGTGKKTDSKTKKTPPMKKATPVRKEASTGEVDIWSLSDEEFEKQFGGRTI